ncbi:MAG: PadR family transcriptional regulator [Phycisphaerales bacterium]
MAELSELEHCVLGVVSLRQPCTPYALRKVFLDSPSAHWSGSAGAIYPLVRRLERAGLLRSAPDESSGRAARVYRVTPAGRRRLRAWLAPPLDARARFEFDPLRLRVRFLGALLPAQQEAFFKDAADALDAAHAEAQATLDASPLAEDPWRHAASLGALRAIESRRAWLEEIRNLLPAGGVE